MSIISASLQVPRQGLGPITDVSAMVGSKTVQLTGKYSGTYTLLASHDDVDFSPIAQFSSDQGLQQTITGAFKSMRLQGVSVQDSIATCEVSAINGLGENSFGELADIPGGSSQYQSNVIDTYSLFPPTGLEEEINVICEGAFYGRIVVEGSINGTSFSPLAAFNVNTPPEVQQIDLNPIPISSLTRYLRVYLAGGYTTTRTKVTIGGRIPAMGGGGTVVQVDTIAAARSYTPATGTITVLGYNTVGDGGGGPYWWSAASMAVDNGGTVLRPNYITPAQPGRWILSQSAAITSKTFGAMGNDTSIDTVGLQGCIDNGGIVTDGIYLLDRPLRISNFRSLSGVDSERVTLRNAPGFVGTALIVLDVPYTARVTVENVKLLSDNPAVAALRQVGTNWVINSSFKNLLLDCAYGIFLNSYTQACDIGGILSTGRIEQLLCLAGNQNVIDGIDHEGTAGSTTESVIRLQNHLYGSDGNVFRNILIEGTGSSQKTPFVMDGVGSVLLENYWAEFNPSNGYYLEIANGDSVVEIRQPYRDFGPTYGKVKITNVREVLWDVVDLISFTVGLDEIFEVDSRSHLTINLLRTQNGSNVYRLSNLGARMTVRQAYNNLVYVDNSPGFSTTSVINLCGSNRLLNPSFELGQLGWDSNAPFTLQLVPSPVSSGLAAHVTWANPNGYTWVQNVPIAASQVGIPLTFTCLVRCLVGVAGSGAITVYVNGAGLPEKWFSDSMITGGWQLLTQTIIPQAAGTLTIGVYTAHTSEILIDECSLTTGSGATPNQSNFQSIAIGQIAYFSASSPPAGTYPHGSRCDNDQPSVGQPLGWVYLTGTGWVVAGTL